MKLKPCPFCGHKTAPGPHALCLGALTRWHSIYCNADHGGCGAKTGSFRDPKDAEKSWNGSKKR
jgi:hypothetical protein